MAVLQLGRVFVSLDNPQEVRLEPYEVPTNTTIIVEAQQSTGFVPVNFAYFLLGAYYRVRGVGVKGGKVTKWFPSPRSQVFSIYIPELNRQTANVIVWIKPIVIYPGKASPAETEVTFRTQTNFDQSGYFEI